MVGPMREAAEPGPATREYRVVDQGGPCAPRKLGKRPEK